MSKENDTGEKTEDPTPRKIEESRRKGEVAFSKELNSVLILAASVLTLTLSMVYIYEQLNAYIQWLYSLDPELAFEGEAFKSVIKSTVGVALRCVAPIFFVVLCTSILACIAQVGFLYAPEVLNLKFDRINPVNGFKRLFSLRSIVEALKAIFKFSFILGIVYYFFKDRFHSFGGFLHVEYQQGFLYGKNLVTTLAIIIVISLIVIALADMAYQKYAYWQKLKMTKYEAKKDSKEQEGNPEVKQRIRTIQREMSQKKMMSEIPNADVVVTNPTHISIVIKYDGEKMISPEVVGKGADLLALRIRQIAQEHNVPIVENIPLARTLYKTVDEGEAVPRGLYKAVAEVLAFVYKLKRKESATSNTQARL